MSFDWNKKMQDLMDSANSFGQTINGLKAQGIYSREYLNQKIKEGKSKLQQTRDSIINDYIADNQKQMAEIKDKAIKEKQTEDPTAALLKFMRTQNKIKGMSTDELKDAAFAYKANGFINDPEKNDADYVNTVMAELGTRKEFSLSDEMKDAMHNSWHTDEPWMQHEDYKKAQGNIDSVNINNQYLPDSLWLDDAGPENGNRNTIHSISDYIPEV